WIRKGCDECGGARAEGDRAIRACPATRRERLSRLTVRDLRFEYQIVPSDHPALRFLQCRTRGDGAQRIEKHCIRVNLQVEVEKTVHQDAQASNQRGKSQNAIGIFGPIGKLRSRAAECRYQKPERDAEPDHSCFYQQLQVIVVRLIHEKAGVETAKLRIDLRE